MIILEKKEELKEESKEEPLCKSIEFDGECIPNRFYRYFISVYVLKSTVDDITNYENLFHATVQNDNEVCENVADCKSVTNSTRQKPLREPIFRERQLTM